MHGNTNISELVIDDCNFCIEWFRIKIVYICYFYVPEFFIDISAS